MKRPIVQVIIRDEASGSTLHSEKKSAFNSGIRASEVAIREIARAEHTSYEGERPIRIGDVYTRRWVSKNGRAIIATIELAPAVEETKMAARRTSRKPNPETAGIEYATAQLESDYFMDWVRDQLAEAADMDPSEVLPLETKKDATVIAKNMLQQLEWDTMRDISVPYEFAGGGSPGTEKAFLSGVRRGYSNPSTVDWLADELLELKGQMRSGGVREAPHGRRIAARGISDEKKQRAFNRLDHFFGSPSNQKKGFPSEDAAANSAATLLAGQLGIKYGTAIEIVKEWYRRGGVGEARHVRDYIAVDRRDRPVGPRHKGYSDAKRDADNAGGTVKFVPSGAREGRRPKAVRSTRRRSR